MNPRGFTAINPEGRVDVSGGVTVPDPVTIGQNFIVSFNLKEYQGGYKAFEYVELWIQNGSGQDLYTAQRWENETFSPNQEKSYQATTFLDPAYGREPGAYRAIVRCKIAGGDPFNFGVVSGSGAMNPRSFTAINPEGRVDVSGGVTVPDPVTVGQNFNVSFNLKEYQGGYKAFEYVELWIQNGSGQDLYTAQRWENETFSPNQEKSYQATTFLDPAYGREPGAYRAIVRCKIAGGDPFNFGVVSGSGAMNPRSFTAIKITKPTLVSPAENVSITTPTTTFTWAHPYNDQYELIIKDPTSGAIVHQSGYITEKSHTANWRSLSSGQTLVLGKQYKWYVVVKVDAATDSSVDRYFTYNYIQLVKPTVAQWPMSGPPGTEFTQWGTGFTQNGSATLYIRKADGTEYDPIVQQVEQDGSFELTYTSSIDKLPGLYAWWAFDTTTGSQSNTVEYSISQLCDTRADVYVRVIRHDTPIINITVSLEQNRNSTEAVTNADGIALFPSMECGTYTAKASANGKFVDKLIEIRTDQLQKHDLELPLNGQPVILVPGIIGSTIGSYDDGAYPELTKDKPTERSKLHIHAPRITGFKPLKDKLKDLNFAVYEAPWDWRLDANTAANIYLWPVIYKALNEHPEFAKVHLVTHSTGGLLARSFIQNTNNLWKKIGKVAMVGVPNLGSSHPYFIWEGGDPQSLDAIAGQLNPSLLPSIFYTRTMEELYETYNGFFGCFADPDFTDHKKIREFITQQVDLKGLGNLMTIEPILQTDESENSYELKKVSHPANTWLEELNTDPNLKERMSADIVEGKVQVGLFVGKSKQTIKNIHVNGPGQDIYEDGIPRRGFYKERMDPGAPDLIVVGASPLIDDVEIEDGDGTVPYSSAQWPQNDGWADMVSDNSLKSHAYLVESYVSEIVDWLSSSDEVSVNYSLSAHQMETGDAVDSPMLTVTARGPVRFLITDQSGHKVGVDLQSLQFINEINGAHSTFDEEGGEVSLTVVSAGTYRVAVFGSINSAFRISTSYVNDTVVENVKFKGYFYDKPLFYTVDIVDDSEHPVTITPEVLPPSNLRAEPYVFDSREYTRLRWGQGMEDGITFYHVFFQPALGSPVEMLDSLPASIKVYDTMVPWSTDDLMPVASFAIASEHQSADVSFFSNIVENNDRDHDGLTDAWEGALGSDMNSQDSDNDGLNDGQEYQRGTNVLNVDTDGDEFNDYEEILIGTDPLDSMSYLHWYSIVSGLDHTVALKSDRTLWSWGENFRGQLGDGTTTDRYSPVHIGADNTWDIIAAGYFHTIALKSDGTLWAWGNNSSGKLGDGTTTDRYSPVQIGSYNSWIAIDGGGYHTVGLKSDGTLWAWGNNGIGQLGDGTTTDRYYPVQIVSDNSWTAVEAGELFTVGLKSDGTLWAWGHNRRGQLGDGTTSDRYSPVQIGSDNSWIAIKAGAVHTLGLKSDGTLWAWGYNSNGQLGDGTTTDRYYPVQIGFDNTWINIKAGGLHSLALKSNDTLWAWGYNSNGQLGDGTTTDRHSPVLISSDNLWTVIQAGGSHTAALKLEGTLWTWGKNLSGQLGDGTMINRYVPVEIEYYPVIDGDYDGDGLLDYIEYIRCTSATDADSDDDGMDDGTEDANRNGMVDPGETDPCNIDSDGDGIQDGTERGYTLNDIGPDTDLGIFQPDLDPTSVTDPMNPDTDGDGFLDGEEDNSLNGRVDNSEMDPLYAYINRVEPAEFDPHHLVLDFNELTAASVVHDQYAGMGLIISGTSGYDGSGEIREPLALPDSLDPADKYLCPSDLWEDPTAQSYIFTFSGLNVSQFGIWTHDGWNKHLSAYDADYNLLGIVNGDGSSQPDQFLGINVNNGNVAEVIVSGDVFLVDDLMMSATLNFDTDGDDDVDGEDLAEFAVSISDGSAVAEDVVEFSKSFGKMLPGN